MSDNPTVTGIVTCKADRHGTAQAYNHNRCRCPEALADVRRNRKMRQLEYMRGTRAPREPALASRRRIQALMAIGWRASDIAARVGSSQQQILKITRVRDWCTADTAEKIRTVYDALWNTPGPSQRTRDRAKRRGWLPPLWWDDDRISDPTYNPRKDVVGAGAIRHETKEARIAEVMRLRGMGLSLRQIAEEVRVTARQVSRDIAEAEANVDKATFDRLAEEEAEQHDGDCCDPDDMESVA